MREPVPGRSDSAWNVLVHQLKAGQTPDPALIRATYREHESTHVQGMEALYSKAMELRAAFVTDALILMPAETPTLDQQIQSAIENQTSSAPTPQSRHGWLVRVPFLRRWLK